MISWKSPISISAGLEFAFVPALMGLGNVLTESNYDRWFNNLCTQRILEIDGIPLADHVDRDEIKHELTDMIGFECFQD